VIIDLFSSRVVGWAISNRMKQDLALRALNMAIRCPAADVYIRERGDPKAAARLHSSHGSRVEILSPPLSEDAA
jgi:putative transposase